MLTKHNISYVVQRSPISHLFRNPLSTQANAVKLDNLELEDWSKARSYNDIPGPTRFELIRAFMPGGEYYEKPFTDYISAARERYGDIYLLPGLFGKVDTVACFNVDDIQKTLRTEGVWPTRPGLDSLTYYRKKYRADLYKDAQGLIVSRGKEWAEFRTAVNPVLMQSKNTKSFVTSMQGVSTEFIARIRDIRNAETKEVPKDFIGEINRFTFESVAVVALNKQLGLIRTNRDRADAKNLFTNLSTFLELIYDIEFKPSLWKYVWTPTFARYRKALDMVFETTMGFVDEALERCEKEHQTNANDHQLSVLEKLIKIDKKVAIVMAIDMLMAGVDTTSSILSGILLDIATNPEKQAKLREEIRQFLPEKDSLFTVESLANLPYLRACIKESIRLHPIGPAIPRSTGEDITLMGYQVPKGTTCMLAVNLLAKDERYFKQAEKYLPERWIRGGSEQQSITPFTYIPFGFGPRMCVGRRIVDLELETILARLVRNFYIEFNYPTENAFKSYFLNTPAIPLTFKFDEVEN